MTLPMVHQTSEITYDAFVSYSRQEKEFAKRLQKALEEYKPPKDLDVPQRHLRIFRDEQDFTGTEYYQSLDKHLQDSAKVIVICSPAARQSSFVNDELRRFVKIKGVKNIIPLLSSGIPNNEAIARPVRIFREGNRLARRKSSIIRFSGKCRPADR